MAYLDLKGEGDKSSSRGSNAPPGRAGKPQIEQTWKGTTWFIEGDIRDCFLEDWRWNATLSGCPQGGVVSPVLSNIYLDRMDKWAGTVLIRNTPGEPAGKPTLPGRRWPTR
jgi:hypothetical protein